MKNTCVFILLLLFHFASAQNDCPEAITVCGDGDFFDIEATGPGSTFEITPGNACLSGENNTMWLRLHIDEGGTFGFVLTPMNSALVTDFDFWLFGPNAACGALGSSLRCSTTNPLNAGLDYVTTGMNDIETDTSEGPGSDGNAFVQWITVQDNEIYYLIVDRPHGDGNFSIEWTGTATFYPIPVFNNPDNISLDLAICDHDGVDDDRTTFDLATHGEMLIGDQEEVLLSYHLNLNDVTTGQDPIANPSAYINTSNPQTIFMRMTNTVTGCFSTETFTIEIDNIPVSAFPPENMIACDTDGDGIETFVLSDNDAYIIGGEPEKVVAYYRNVTDANNEQNPLPAVYQNQEPFGTETIWARIENSNGCVGFDMISFTITVDPMPVFNNPQNISLDLSRCDDDAVNDESAAFDLSTHAAMLLGTQDTVILTYHESEEDALAGEGSIDPENYFNTSNPQTIYMRMASILTDCYVIESFQLEITNPVTAGQPEDLSLCDTALTGFRTFDLTQNDDNIINGIPDRAVSYHSSQEDAENDENPLPGLYDNAIPNSTETIWARVENTAGCWGHAVTSFTITVLPQPFFNNPDSISLDLEQCDDEGEDDEADFFDLTTHEAMLIEAQENTVISYHESALDAENNENPIAAPEAYLNTSNPQTIYMRITNTESLCYDTLSFEIEIINPVQAGEPEDLYLCDYNENGLQEFNLALNDDNIINGNPGRNVVYYPSLEDAENEENALPDLYQNETPYTSQTIWGRVENITGCYGHDIASFTINVVPLPVFTNPDNISLDLSACGDGDTAVFDLTTHANMLIGTQGNVVITYHTSQEDADNGENPIEDFFGYTNLSNPQTIYMRMTNTTYGCFKTLDFQLQVFPPPVVPVLDPLAECDPNNDHHVEFNLQGVLDELGAAIGNVTVTAHETVIDAQFGTNDIEDTESYANIDPDNQVLYIRVESDQTGCFAVRELELIVNPVPEATTPEPYELCDNGLSDTDGIARFNLTTREAEVLGTLDPAQYTVTYHESNNDAITGTPVIATPANYNSASGTVYIRVENNATGCYDIVGLELIVNPLPTANQPTPYTLCDENIEDPEIETFDLTTKIPEIIGEQQGLLVTFHFNFADAEAGTNAIANPQAYPNNPVVQSLFVRVTTEETGCYRIVILDVRVAPLPVLDMPEGNQVTVCDTNGQGIGEFDLEALVEDMINNVPTFDVTFHLTADDAETGLNPIPNTNNYQNVIPGFDTVYVRVVDTETGCFNSYALNLIVEPAPQAPALEDLVQCDDLDNNGQDNRAFFDLTQQNAVIEAALGVAPGELTIHYFTSEAFADAGAPRITAAGNYYGTNGQTIWVRVEDPDTEGCYSLSSFQLILNQPLAITAPPVLSICETGETNDGREEFDLTVMEDTILGPFGIGQGYTVQYFESQAAVDANTPIADPENYTNPAPPAGNPKTIYVVVTSPEGCRSYTTMTIKVLPLPVPDTTPNALVMCDDNGDSDGQEVFDLTQAEDDIRDNDGTVILTYHELEADADAGINPIADPTAYESGNATIYVRVEAVTGNPADTVCYVVVPLELIVNPLPALGENGTIAPYAICEQNTDGVATFNFNEHMDEILGEGTNQEDYTVRFYRNEADLAAGIAMPYIYTNTTTPEEIIVWVRHDETGCTTTAPLTLLVEEAAIANPITTIFDTCDTDGTNDGMFTFDLTVVEPEVLGAQDPAEYSVTYYTSGEDAENGENAIADPTAFHTTEPDLQTIYVRVTNTATVSGCHDITTVDLNVERLPEPALTGGTICVDFATGDVLSTHLLDTGLDGATHTFRWFLDGNEIAGATGPTHEAGAAGAYSVIATSIPGGCESEPVDPVQVLRSGPASPVGEGYFVTNAFSENQTITILVEGYGDYEFSLDNGPWQPSNIFTNVSPGVHEVHVRDTNGGGLCGEITLTGMKIIDYMNFFTPNGDGIRDNWNIIGLEDQPDAKIYIFDRYGKLIKQISAAGEGWDGTYNGNRLPATDYWFTVTYWEIIGTIKINKEFRAHFSLLR